MSSLILGRILMQGQQIHQILIWQQLCFDARRITTWYYTISVWKYRSWIKHQSLQLHKRGTKSVETLLQWLPNNNGKAWINISEAYNCASHICWCHILCSGVIFRQYFVSRHQLYSEYILKRMYIWTIFSKYTYFMVKWSQNLIFISALLSPLSCTEYNEGLLQLKIISKTTWGAHPSVS